MPASGSTSTGSVLGFRVDELWLADIDAAVQLHQTVMAGEFLAGCGSRFLRGYYRAWMHTPTAIAMAARETETGQLIGLLLGSGDPATHYRSMVRHSGLRLGVQLGVRAISHPAWGDWLVRSRGLRYLRGILRLSVRRRATTTEPSAARADAGPRDAYRVGEITHLMVDQPFQGHGIGRALVEEACRRARLFGVDRMVVVTPAGWSAERFYTRLGWTCRGEVRSASGEHFVRYEHRLAASSPSGGACGGRSG